MTILITLIIGYIIGGLVIEWCNKMEKKQEEKEWNRIWREAYYIGFNQANLIFRHEMKKKNNFKFMTIKLTKEEVQKICIDYIFDKFSILTNFIGIDYENDDEFVFIEIKK